MRYPKELILIFPLILFNIFAVGQNTFTVGGQLKVCYDSTAWTGTFEDFTVFIVDLEPHYKVGQEILASESGEFSFESLDPSNYKISTVLFEFSDTVVQVDKDIMDLTLCVDNSFKPVPPDILAKSITQARKDIEEHNLKVYHLCPGLAIYKPGFKWRNKRLKRKFDFQIEVISCLMVTNREAFIAQEKYLAYNKVATEYLDKKYGTSWKKR